MFEYPPEIAADKFFLPYKCGFCSVRIATCSSNPYDECSVNESSFPHRLIRDTSSETRGLTPALPSCEILLHGLIINWMHDASEIVPDCGVPVCASKPHPYVTAHRFASVHCRSPFFPGRSPCGFFPAAITSLNSAMLYRFRCVCNNAVWSSGSPGCT